MTENALKKILTMTVMKEFPEIEEILIIGDDFNDIDDSYIKRYKVFFGITPKNTKKVDTSVIREKIKAYSSYILNPKKEKIDSILLFNPEGYN